MKADRKYKPTFLWLIIFGIAMGFLEAIIVVYIRQIYYPSGFDFPMKIFDDKFLYIETLREFATIVMLISIGVLAGKSFLQKFCYFLFSFAIWDIFYYVGLKLLLDWPPSLLTWDILFLIPITWVSPVLAPVISSIIFIIFSVTVIIFHEKGIIKNLNKSQWILFFTGVFIVFVVFIWEYAKIIIAGGYISHLGSLAKDQKFISEMTSYVPASFNWIFFFLGELLMILRIIILWRKNIWGRKTTLPE
jgi:hypothetical protein